MHSQLWKFHRHSSFSEGASLFLALMEGWDALPLDSFIAQPASRKPRIRRKPVPRRYSVRQWASSNERPASSKSFSAAFSRIGAVLPGREQEQKDLTPDDIQQIYRFTSRFDPRMEMGLTPYIPFPAKAGATYRKSPRELTITDALNMNWRLPRLAYTTSVVNQASISLFGNVSTSPDGGTLAWLQVLGSFFLFFNSW